MNQETTVIDTDVHTLSLHHALPILTPPDPRFGPSDTRRLALQHHAFSSLECSCPLKPSSCASASRFAPGGTRRHRWLSRALTSVTASFGQTPRQDRKSVV